MSSVVDALMTELQTASLVLGFTQRNQALGILSPQWASLQDKFKAATQATNRAVEQATSYNDPKLMLFQSSALGIALSDALNLARLERVRQLTITGGEPIKTIASYDAVIQTLTLYQARLEIPSVIDTPSDLNAFAGLFAIAEQSAASVTLSLSSYLSSTIPGFVSTTTDDGLQLMWSAAGVLSVLEPLLRFGTSQESFSNNRDTVSLKYRDPTNLLNSIVYPQRTVQLSDTLTINSMAGRAVAWNASMATTLLFQAAASAVVSFDTEFSAALRNTTTNRSLTQLIALLLLLLINVTALVYHAFNAFFYHKNRDMHAQHNREAHMFQRSITRMSKFVLMVASLDIASMSKVLKYATKSRNGLPHEETQLYQCLSSVRDAEPFILPTVKVPPPNVPTEALTKHKLFVKPALLHFSNAVAIRVSLNCFQGSFSNAGVKQKALQHQMSRYLSVLQDTADSLIGPNSGLLNVYGDHAMMWLNVLTPLKYPTVFAAVITRALEDECVKLSIRLAQLSICAGPTIAGHVSNAPPGLSKTGAKTKLVPLTTFATFGVAARDSCTLGHLMRVHDVPFCFNHHAVQQYCAELRAVDKEMVTNRVAAGLNNQQMERIQSLRLVFRPLEPLVYNNDDKEGLPSTAYVNEGTATRKVPDFSRDRGTDWVAPAFSATRNGDEERVTAWYPVMDALMDAARKPSEEACNRVKRLLTVYQQRYPGVQPSLTRVASMVSTVENISQLNPSASSMKQSRLAAMLLPNM